MATPCEQENTIQVISQTLARMEKTQEHIIDLLKAVANQSARIEALEDHKDQCLKNADILFERVRDLELDGASNGPTQRAALRTTLDELEDKINKLDKKLDRMARIITLLTHRYFLVGVCCILALVLVGAIMDIIYHWDTIKAAWLFWKGKG